MRRLRSPRLAALACGAAALPLAAACAARDPSGAPAAAAVLDLGTMPWASQPDGSPDVHDVAPQPSLGFPPGTSYAQALTQLLAAAGSGALPDGVTVGDPLPAEVVYVEPADPGTGIRLSLTAPWGWVARSGAILAPSISLPSTLTPAEAERAAVQMRDSGGVLPEDARVDVPDLPACQVAHGDPAARPPC